MKKILLTVAALLCLSLCFAQSGEQQLNSEYQSAIREFLQQDIANRQRTMQRSAEQILISLPNTEKLYDETYISIRTQLVDGTREDGTSELNYLFDISYNCRHLEGYTDDYPLGVFDYDSSNSVRAICNLTKTFIEGILDDIFRPGKAVSIKIFSTTDGVELSRVIPYDGQYGNFRYMPVVFNNEQLRISVDTNGIKNNCQLAYIRAQSVRDFLQNNIRNLTRTTNDFSYVTRSYTDTGAYYRRSSIEITVHDAFRETIDLMTADKIQDDYVDFNIPQSTSPYDNAYVLIVANEDYDHAFLPSVPFASNDGEILRQYFVRALGVPERQVKVLHNASRAAIYEGIQWLTDLSQAVASHIGDQTISNANIFVYFAGHGFTDFDGNAYLVPNNLRLDGIKALGGKKGCGKKKKNIVEPTVYDIALSRKEAALFAKQCVSIDSLCAALKGKGKRETYPISRLTVIVDASFDGHQRNGALMLRADRKVVTDAKAKKAKRKANKNSDAIVLLAAAADKTAYSFDAQHHGFLTYFLLKEIKGLASTSDFDSYTYQDIYEAVERKLNKESALQGKWQVITGFVDGKYAAAWQNLHLR
jgi:hypothetical protein